MGKVVWLVLLLGVLVVSAVSDEERLFDDWLLSEDPKEKEQLEKELKELDRLALAEEQAQAQAHAVAVAMAEAVVQAEAVAQAEAVVEAWEEGKREQRELSEKREMELEDSLNDALDMLFQESIEEELVRQNVEDEQRVTFQSYREIEEGEDMAEAIPLLNSLVMSLFPEPEVQSVEGPTIIVTSSPPLDEDDSRFSTIISGLVGSSELQVELVGAEEEEEEEEEERDPSSGLDFSEEFCYQLPFELEVECLTAVIQMLRDENDNLRGRPSQEPSEQKPLKEHHHYHHHHHQDNRLLIAVGLLCLLVGGLVGRCGRKRKPCKVIQYRTFPPQSEGEKGKPQVEGEEREFYPYYVAASV